MTFDRLLIVELPFALNLPNGEYCVPQGTDNFLLQIAQNQFAVPIISGGKLDYRLGSTEELTKVFGDQLGRYFQLPLRTVVKKYDSISVQQEQIVSPSEKQVVEEHVRFLIVSGKTTNAGDALFAEATDAVKSFQESERKALQNLTAKKLTARKLFSNSEFGKFHVALNGLIRLYMTSFSDQFVEEVAMHQLGSTFTTGIHRVIHCDGEQIDSVSEVGKVPPMMKGPWFYHSPEKVEEFKKQLSGGIQSDPVDLLCIRSKSQFERGAYRSAIIEASAALETVVERRIRAGLRANGKSEAEIEACLDETKLRFVRRAEHSLKTAIGKSIDEIDSGLWRNVKTHRDNYRHKIAHSDSEPPKAESEKAVDDFAALALLVKTA